ncbi:hypothetical protein [Paenibacillus periandrae]|uniref:hypothetical protein n=1 Tax=Paenibacillus periandrae TaxID=1761741 RepID=UPI001F08C130|nr:hypothetical protein [Paenibacillus periandrae]
MNRHSVFENYGLSNFNFPNSNDRRTFDSSIESNYVVESGDDGYFILDDKNKLNIRAIKMMEDLEGLLQQWTDEYPDDVDFEDYECSLREPKFWDEWLEINVR